MPTPANYGRRAATIAAILAAILLAGRYFWHGDAGAGPPLDLSVQGDLLGYTVNDVDQRSLGVVADLILEVSTGRVEYIVVEVPSGNIGSMEAKDEHMIPVPWHLLRAADPPGTLEFERPATTLYNAPHFRETPNTGEPDWDQPLRTYWMNLNSS